MKIKGSTLVHTRTYLRKNWGSELASMLEAKLAPAIREVYCSGNLTNYGWYPVAVWNAVLDEVARWPGKGGTRTIRDMTAFIASQDLTLAHKVLLKLGSPALVMRQASTFWSTYFNGGDLIAHQRNERHFKIVLHLGTDPQTDPGRLTCREAIPAWQENAIRLAGGIAGQSLHMKCRFEGHTTCEFDVTWR
jgi:hypothetical protein